MPTPQIIAVQVGNITLPWAEFIKRGAGSTAEAAFGPDANQASMTIIVNFFELDQIIIQILGWPRSLGTGLGINREIPMRHPFYPQLWAKKITRIMGIKFLDKITGTDPGTGPGTYSNYLYASVDILFTTVPYRVMGDVQLNQTPTGLEYERYCEVRPQPAGQILNVEKSQNIFHYAQQYSANQPPIGNTSQSAIPFGQTILIPKKEIHVTWYEVPHLGLFNSTDPFGLTVNIDKCIGTVNNSAIWGYEEGTLLFDPPRFTPVMAGVPAGFMGLNDAWDPPRTWNVEFIIKWFDPPNDLNGGHTNSRVRGWNIVPFYPPAGSPLGAITYFLVTTDGSSTGPTIYRTSNFQNAFLMCG